MNKNRKEQAVRRIRDMLDQQARPTLLEAGLSEEEFQEMDKEGMFDKGFGEVDEGLGRYVILGLRAPAISLLALADVPSHHIATGILQRKSRASRILSWLGSKLWDVVRMTCSAIIGGVVGWYLKKHFP